MKQKLMLTNFAMDRQQKWIQLICFDALAPKFTHTFNKLIYILLYLITKINIIKDRFSYKCTKIPQTRKNVSLVP